MASFEHETGNDDDDEATNANCGSFASAKAKAKDVVTKTAPTTTKPQSSSIDEVEKPTENFLPAAENALEKAIVPVTNTLDPNPSTTTTISDMNSAPPPSTQTENMHSTIPRRITSVPAPAPLIYNPLQLINPSSQSLGTLAHGFGGGSSRSAAVMEQAKSENSSSSNTTTKPTTKKLKLIDALPMMMPNPAIIQPFPMKTVEASSSSSSTTKTHKTKQHHAKGSSSKSSKEAAKSREQSTASSSSKAATPNRRATTTSSGERKPRSSQKHQRSSAATTMKSAVDINFNSGDLTVGMPSSSTTNNISAAAAVNAKRAPFSSISGAALSATKQRQQHANNNTGSSSTITIAAATVVSNNKRQLQQQARRAEQRRMSAPTSRRSSMKPATEKTASSRRKTIEKKTHRDTTPGGSVTTITSKRRKKVDALERGGRSKRGSSKQQQKQQKKSRKRAGLTRAELLAVASAYADRPSTGTLKSIPTYAPCEFPQCPNVVIFSGDPISNKFCTCHATIGSLILSGISNNDSSCAATADSATTTADVDDIEMLLSTPESSIQTPLGQLTSQADDICCFTSAPLNISSLTEASSTSHRHVAERFKCTNASLSAQLRSTRRGGGNYSIAAKAANTAAAAAVVAVASAASGSSAGSSVAGPSSSSSSSDVAVAVAATSTISKHLPRYYLPFMNYCATHAAHMLNQQQKQQSSAHVLSASAGSAANLRVGSNLVQQVLNSFTSTEPVSTAADKLKLSRRKQQPTSTLLHEESLQPPAYNLSHGNLFQLRMPFVNVENVLVQQPPLLSSSSSSSSRVADDAVQQINKSYSTAMHDDIDFADDEQQSSAVNSSLGGGATLDATDNNTTIEIIDSALDKCVELIGLYNGVKQRCATQLREAYVQYVRDARKEAVTLGSCRSTAAKLPGQNVDYERMRTQLAACKLNSREQYLLRDEVLLDRYGGGGGGLPTATTLIDEKTGKIVNKAARGRAAAGASNVAAVPPSQQQCAYRTSRGLCCASRAAPMSPFCCTHIGFDRTQHLFTSCPVIDPTDGNVCGVASVPFHGHKFCDLHRTQLSASELRKQVDVFSSSSTATATKSQFMSNSTHSLTNF